MWRKHRALIESAEIPEPYACAIIGATGVLPEESDDDSMPTNILAADYMDGLIERCVEEAHQQAAA
jgi:hypothetical protein